MDRDDQWLAEQLQANGLVTQAQINAATSAGTGDLCRDLIANRIVQEPQILRFLGLHFQTRYVSTEKLSSANIVQWVLDLLPIAFCEKHLILPVRCDKQKTVLSLVTPDPSDLTVLEEARQQASAQEVAAYVALPHAVEAGIRKFYRGDLHAFARMDESLRQNYTELLNIYEQRLIDFDAETEGPLEVQPESQVETFRHDELVLTPDVEDTPAPASQEPPAPAVQPRPRIGSGPRVEPKDGSMLSIVELLVDQLERGSGWRSNHSLEVARLTGRLADRIGLSSKLASDLYLAALLHELGKPNGIHLTAMSIDSTSAHRKEAGDACQVSSKLLGDKLPDVEPILAALYERPDGQGVPGRLDGNAVPITTRLLQVSDAFCDLVTNPDASPKGPLKGETALSRLREAASRGVLDEDAVMHLGEIQGLKEDRSGQPLVLIIDEDTRTAAELENHLSGAGLNATMVHTTGDAALVLLGEDVRLVICEVDLRPMDGFSFLQWIRSNQRTTRIPFMFVSNRADVNDVNRGFELGAVDYIVKPYRPEVLLAKIKRTIQK